MTCPQLDGNKITFTIPDTYVATVIVCFHGTKRKLVDVLWGDGTGANWDSCDAGIEPGASYPEHFDNVEKMEYEATVRVYYDGLECSTEPAPQQPADNSLQLMSNCNAFGPNPVVVGAWMFQAPGSGDTVQVTLVVEDSAWGGT